MNNRTKRKKNAVSAISQSIDLPMDVITGLPLMKIIYGRELVIEGRCRLAEYTEESIIAICGKRRITVAGNALSVKLMDSCALVVSGNIEGLTFGE